MPSRKFSVFSNKSESKQGGDRLAEPCLVSFPQNMPTLSA